MNEEKEKKKDKRNEERKGGKSDGLRKSGVKYLKDIYFGTCYWLIGIKRNFVRINNNIQYAVS